MLNIICSGCGKGLYVDDKYLGQWGKCKYCGEQIQVIHTSLEYLEYENKNINNLEYEEKVVSKSNHKSKSSPYGAPIADIHWLRRFGGIFFLYH